MLKKTITYKDFNGEEVSEDFFFHLSKAELVELEMSHKGGLSESLQRIIDAEDNKEIIAEFKNIILTAYGKRSEDGRRFIKNQELRDEFISSEAYSELFMELVTDTDAAITFVNGVIPAALSEEAAKAAGIDSKQTPIIAVVTEESKPEPKTVTPREVEEMSPEEVKQLADRLKSGEVVIMKESQ